MERIPFLKKEHDEIRKEIRFIEKMIDGEIDFIRLLISFSRLQEVWDLHEEKEAQFFMDMHKKKEIPLERILFEHRILRGHKKVIWDALSSGDPQTIKIALDTDGRMLFDKLKEHLIKEETLFWMLEKNHPVLHKSLGVSL